MRMVPARDIIHLSHQLIVGVEVEQNKITFTTNSGDVFVVRSFTPLEVMEGRVKNKKAA